MNYLYISILFLVLSAQTLWSQSFNVHMVQSEISIVQGDPIKIPVSITIDNGFNASINLVALNSCIAPLINFSSNPVNFPYDQVLLTINKSDLISPGSYPIIVKGTNGNVSSEDTIVLNVKESVSLKWHQFNYNNSGITSNDIQEIKFDNLGNLWYVSGGGPGRPLPHVGVYNGTIWSKFNADSNAIYDNCRNLIQFNSIQFLNNYNPSFYIDSIGNKWVISGTRIGLIDRFNKVRTFDSLDYPIDQNLICISGKGGKIYFGTNKGILSYDGKNLSNLSPEISSYIYSIEVDNSGTIWFLSYVNDKTIVNKYDGKFLTTFNASNSILGEGIEFINVVDGIVYAGGKGLYKFSDSKWIGLNYFENNIIKKLQGDSKGRLIAYGNTNSLDDDQLFIYDHGNFYAYNQENSNVPFDYNSGGAITDITINNYGKIFISTGKQGIVSLDLDRITATQFPVFSMDKSNFTISPNPAVQSFNLSVVHVDLPISVEISDMQGVLIYASILGDQESNIRLPECKPGLYLISINTAIGPIIKKLIIE